jgi:hypothetical protein
VRAAVDVEHIMHANEELGLAPRGPGAASRPQPPTRQLWDDEVGSVLDLFRAPDVHGHSWYMGNGALSGRSTPSVLMWCRTCTRWPVEPQCGCDMRPSRMV